MGYVIGKILGYADHNYALSRYDLAKLKYMLEMIFVNTAEFVFWAALFNCDSRAFRAFVFTFEQQK